MKPLDPREVKLEYYSSLLDRKSDTSKCFSDDCLEYSNSYAKRRPAVTEPTTPTASRGPPLPESELSETESQSSVLSDAPSPVRPVPPPRSLSNSLESLLPRRRTKRRVSRKTSISSTSSYDTRPEPVARRMRKSASCHVKKDGSEPCKCFLDQQELPISGTKSLPRNHKHHAAISRYLHDAIRCEKDCLKILKAVSKEEARPPGPTYSRRGDSEESYFEYRTSSLPKKSKKPQYPKTAEIKKIRPVAIPTTPTLALLPPTRFQTIERLEAKRAEKKREKFEEHLQDECVLRIENGDLWIEICKAVQETEGRSRRVRPRD